MTPRCTSPDELASALPEGDPARLASARSRVAERAIDYPFGSGQAEEIALFGGWKPLYRQLLDPGDLPRARARCTAHGLSAVEEAPHAHGHAGRTALFVGRDPDLLRAAADCERSDDAVGLGSLLGYPACCVAAFAATPVGIRVNPVLHARALAATAGPPAPRLNVIDLAVFHYLPWLPCSFACAPSLAFADRVAARIAEHHGASAGEAPADRPPIACTAGCEHQRFVDRIDAALAAHRLLLFEEVQLSLTGRFDGRRVHIERAWPTARDRHPRALLAPAAREAVARLLVAVESASTVTVDGEALLLDDRPLLHAPHALLLPFGAPRRSCFSDGNPSE
ncbi:MAG: hypothetical protein EXR72_09730 [Myxococcales bacterium]|nr:hypothetical protein [Myxococcales bacterium]